MKLDNLTRTLLDGPNSLASLSGYSPRSATPKTPEPQCLEISYGSALATLISIIQSKTNPDECDPVREYEAFVWSDRSKRHLGSEDNDDAHDAVEKYDGYQSAVKRAKKRICLLPFPTSMEPGVRERQEKIFHTRGEVILEEEFRESTGWDMLHRKWNVTISTVKDRGGNTKYENTRIVLEQIENGSTFRLTTISSNLRNHVCFNITSTNCDCPMVSIGGTSFSRSGVAPGS